MFEMETLSTSLPQPGGERQSASADNPTDQGATDAVGPTTASDTHFTQAGSTYEAADQPSPIQDDAAIMRLSGTFSGRTVSSYETALQDSHGQNDTTTTTQCSPKRRLGIAWPETLHLSSMVFGIVIGAVGTGLAKHSADEQPRLTKWTARKDFKEYCSRERELGASPAGCSEILDEPLPPPPLDRRDVHPGLPLHERNRALLHGASSDKETFHTTICAFPLVLLLLWALSRRRALRRAYRWCLSSVEPHSLSRLSRDSLHTSHVPDSITTQAYASASTVEEPSQTSTLRRRRPGAANAASSVSLVEATSRNDARLVQRLLNGGVDVRGTDGKGKSALHHVSRHGQVDLVRPMIQRGALVDAEDGSHKTALYRATRYGHAAVVEQLLLHGAGIRSRDDQDRQPIHLAAEKGFGDVVEVLLQHGAETSAHDQSGREPIHYAVAEGHEKVLELLLRHGADVQALVGNDRQPIHDAARNGP